MNHVAELLASLRGMTHASRAKGGEHDETLELGQGRRKRPLPDAALLRFRRQKALAPSQRLHRRLAPAVRVYYRPGRGLFNHGQPGAAFIRFRICGYHATVAMTDLMLAALDQCGKTVGDPLSTGLGFYLDRHITEEAHDDEPGGLDLKDLAVLGVDPDEVRNSQPPWQIAALVEALERRIRYAHPVVILGFLQLERFHGKQEHIDRFIARTGLPREAFGNMELHCVLEPGHAAELDRQLDTLPIEDWQEEFIFEAADVTLRAMALAFGDAVL